MPTTGTAGAGILFAGLCALALAGLARADGAFFGVTTDRLQGPDQKAIVCWNGLRETLLIASKVQGARVEDVMQAAWIVPVPGTTRPIVGPGSIAPFVTLVRYLAERPGWTDEDEERMHGPPGGALNSSVVLLERLAIDVFDISVLDATDADALLAWLTKNGYRVPAEAKAVLAACIAGGTRFFVANRIDLGSKSGSGFSKARAVLDLLEPGLPAPTALERVRHAVIEAVLAGTPFDASPCATPVGQALAFLDRARYDQLVASCPVGKDGIAKMALFGDHWHEFLMGDRAATEPMRQLPDDVEITVTERGGLSYSGKRLEIGVHKFALDRAGVTLDALRAFVKKSYLDVARKYAKVREALDIKVLRSCLSLEKDVAKLKDGFATPIKIEFEPKEPMYPLRISSINPGPTRVEVYVCAPFAVEDRSLMLTAKESRPIAQRVTVGMRPHLETGALEAVTRLVFEGPSAAFTKDAVFARATGLTIQRPAIGPEGQDFASIFGAARTSDLRKAEQERIEDLVGFAEGNPKSRFADDAAVLAAFRIGAMRADKAVLDRLRQVLRATSRAELHLEDWALLEAPRLDHAKYYQGKGLLKEVLVAHLAEAYASAGDRETGAELAKQVLAALAKKPDDPVIKRLRAELEGLVEAPQQAEASDAVGAVAEALIKGDAARAAELATKITQGPARPDGSGGMMANLHPMTPWFLLGNAELARDRPGPAAAALEKAIELGASLHMGMLMTGESVMSVNANVARVHLCGAYLRLDRVDEALKTGTDALAGLTEHTPGDTPALSLARYNLACAYARKSDKARALEHLKEAIVLEKDFKKSATSDTDFKSIAATPEFQALLK